MKFTKMQGAGNDFIVLDRRDVSLCPLPLPHLIRHICRPHFSLGADGVMIVGPPVKGGSFSMTFYNSDGSSGEMCGNGARCLVCYGLMNGLCSPDRTVSIETPSGLVQGRACPPARNYSVRMPEPSCFRKLTLTIPQADEDIGCKTPHNTGTSLHCTYMELGSPGLPHLVLPLSAAAALLSPAAIPKADPFSFADWETLLRPIAAVLCHHPALSKGANVNFYHLSGENHVTLLTYERGVEDFTLACGSGSCCTAAVLAVEGLISPETAVIDTNGGQLSVSCTLSCPLPQSESRLPVHNIHLSGPAKCIAQGDLLADAIFP